jgi:hypothetical protein
MIATLATNKNPLKEKHCMLVLEDVEQCVSNPRTLN